MIAGIAIAALVQAAAPLPLPERVAPANTIVVATSPALEPVVRRLATASGVRIVVTAPGSDVAMAALYSARADVALIGRDAADPEIKAFEWIYRRRPRDTPVMVGSVGTPDRSPAIAVLVNRANPLRGLTSAQLARVLGDPMPVTWGDLGGSGPLAATPVRLHMMHAEGGTGRFLRASALAGRNQLAWDRIVEHDTPATGPDRAPAAVAAAVAADRAAIGLGAAGAAQGVGIVALDGRVPGEPGYPLSRTIHAYSDPPRGRSTTAAVARFLAFIRSAAGRAIVEDAGFAPLGEGVR